MKTTKLLFIVFISLILFSACANNEIVDACLKGQTYGFWGGLWHGIIAPFDLLAMLFRDDATVFAQNNNGAWYAFGFILGSGGWGILGSKGAKSKKRKRNS
jgi:hypothetical protein